MPAQSGCSCARLYCYEVITIAIPPHEKSARVCPRSSRRLLVLLAMPLICCAFTWVGIRAAHAYLTAQEMRLVNDSLEHKYLTIKQQNERIKVQVNSLQTPAGILRAAREHGYVMPGEVRLRIP